MELCSHNHPEICHEESKCPICAIIEKKDQELSDLENEVTDLKSQVAALESDLEDKE